MKITWFSNAPWMGTGYGGQTAQVVKRLVKDGHEVVISCVAGLWGTPQQWNEADKPVVLLPGGTDSYGNDILSSHHAAWTHGEPGWIVTLFDVWPFDRARFKDQRIASWTPVDHMPVPPKVAEWAGDHLTIAMSRFGMEQFANVGVTARYVPHAIEPIFTPTPSDFRSRLGIPADAFLVIVNAANKGNAPARKAWGEMAAGLSILMHNHPDAWVYFHTDAVGISGVDLRFLMMARGLDPDRIRWADQYAYRVGLIDDGFLAAAYTASDVLLATSMGEGFGITVVEAQACGTPVIVTDFSAQPELVGGGWKVGWQHFWDASQGADFAIPLIGDIAAKLEEARERKGDRELAVAAMAKASEYDADLVYDEHWRPVLAEMADTLDRKPRRVRRAELRAKSK